MNTKQHHRIILTAAAVLSLTLTAFAGGDETTPAGPAPGRTGLLGETYAGLSYRYVDLNGTSGHADDYRFDYNAPIKTGLDGLLSYDWTDTGSANRQQSLLAGLRAFCPDLAWGRPFVEAGAGYAWEKTAGAKDNSFLWQVGAGAEFQVAPAVSVTPFVKYADAPSLTSKGRWDYGVKANYWVDRQWSVTVGLDRDDDSNTGFMVGTNFRF
jgi:hypothetical protein